MKAHLLIIDDDPAGLLALSEALRVRMPDVVVDTTSSGREGLGLIAKYPYTAIICDVVMPDIGGMEFLSAMRKQRPDIPVMLVTAGNLDMKDTAIDSGVAAILSKPLNVDAVINIVRLVTQK